MDRRPESNGNGKSETNGKGTHPMIEVRRAPTPVYSRRSPSLLPWLALCLAASLGFIVFMQDTQPPDQSSDVIPESEAFRWAVNRAMNAAELTQSAQSAAEWQQVTTWWQESIKLMQAVPKSDANHTVAVAKIGEYQKNLEYAQRKLKQGSSQPVSGKGLWSIGSRRASVIKVQGEPTEIDRYDSICKEVLYYGKSEVELNNGVVARYEDFNRNLKVAETDAPILPPADGFSWNLGSTKAQIFDIQGTPTRLISYDYSERETLYYSDSTIELSKERVIGYNNVTGNLRVRVLPIWVNSDQPSNVWTLESSREQLLRVQGTPTQIVSDAPACTEMFRYGDSTVNLKNGFISGYDNLDKNLRVKAQ